MDLNLTQYISEFTDLKTCLEIVCLCKWTSINIKIKYVVDKKLHRKITDYILQQKQYSHLIKLNADNNPKISKINHMTNFTYIWIIVQM